MSRPLLLVLGASRYQLDVIRAGHAMGLAVAVTDNVPANPGHRVADVSCHVDTTDIEAVVALARELQPTGVVAPCTDVAVTTAAATAAALGLPGIPVAAAEILTNKVRFRQHQKDTGARHPPFHTIVENDDSQLDFTAGAWIVKPDNSSGSKGIAIVQSTGDFQRHIGAARRYARGGRVICEQFISGIQGTCEGVLVDGEIAFSLLTDRSTVPPPFVATSAHTVPSTLAPAVQEQVLDEIRNLFRALGIVETVFDCDFVVNNDGAPTVIELTPRLGGNALTALVRTACDVDLAQVAIALACGLPPLLRPASSVQPAAQLILGVNSAGMLHYNVAAHAALCAEPFVRSLEIDVAAGTPVVPFVDGRTRVGAALVVGATRNDVDNNAQRVLRDLDLSAVSG